MTVEVTHQLPYKKVAPPKIYKDLSEIQKTDITSNVNRWLLTE